VADPIPDSTEAVATAVVDAAFAVHKNLGPGLLESVYEVCLCHELARRGMTFQREVTFPIVYEGIRLESGLRIDLLVENCLIVKLKAVEKLNPIFEAQLLTYLRMTGASPRPVN